MPAHTPTRTTRHYVSLLTLCPSLTLTLTLTHSHSHYSPSPHPSSHPSPTQQATEALEALEVYPAEPEVHRYLLDRLTRVTDLDTLYELHYHMITLGKV